MKTVIMAGGKGTRIGSIASDIPKPMIKIDGIPVMEREILCLRDQGFKEYIITVSHFADVIMNYFGNGDKLGVKIEYFVEDKPLGNAGALFKLRDKLKEDFLLINADSIFDIDFKRFLDFHKKKGGLVTLFTHPNSHPYDSGLIISDDQNVVRRWLSKEDVRPVWYKNRVNAGIHIINPKILDNISIENTENAGEGEPVKIDLDRQVLKPLCNTGEMYCYDSPEYVKDMGTPERYAEVCEDFRQGRVESRNLHKKQKAVFVDRDGTINKYVGFLRNINDFELLPGVSAAIKRLNKLGYLVIVVTNQPVIARGEVTVSELNEIHNKMETLLGNDGAYVDAIYYCPHHPDSGYEGEIKALKIKCDCRKPQPGMLLQAMKDYNIDLSQSWMAGDGENDIGAGKNAGCRTVLIGVGDYGQDLTVRSLEEFVNMIDK